MEYLSDAHKSLNLLGRSQFHGVEKKKELLNNSLKTWHDYEELFDALRENREKRIAILTTEVGLSLDLSAFMRGYTEEELAPYTTTPEECEAVLTGEIGGSKFWVGDHVYLKQGASP